MNLQELVAVVALGEVGQEVVGVVFAHRIVLLDIGLAILLQREGVKESGDGDEGLGGADAVAVNTHVTDMVAVVEEDFVVFQTVPRSSQPYGDFVGFVRLRLVFGTGNKTVVLDAAVLTPLHVIVGVVEMKVVAFADVGSEARTIHERGGLMVVVSLSVKVIENATKVEALADIVGKESAETVVTGLLVTTPRVGKVHVGRLGVEVAEALGRRDELV